MTNKDAIYYLQYLRHDVHADSPYDIAIVTAINALSETKPPKTNGDRIRQMTDEELVDLLLWNVCNVCDGRGYELCGIDSHCKEHVAKWLKQEEAT